MNPEKVLVALQNGKTIFANMLDAFDLDKMRADGLVTVQHSADGLLVVLV